jgi:Spy/CpxP family protein refolding chaperone
MPLPAAITDSIKQKFADVADDQMRKRMCALAEDLYKMQIMAMHYCSDNKKIRDRETLMIRQLRVASETNLRLTRMLQEAVRRIARGAPAAPKRIA